ncbi:DNA repair protein RadA [Sporichthya polymorpha]|uniref:DNA repair protein RadA n=1 Tax=Sporichthya polymorpha TaxID=35751 RepID=UPI00037E30A8|nr:DNA repair protein RadA [Sporichthya polymorpha]
MAKATGSRVAYRCGECGWQTAKWVGRCGECHAWSSMSEVVAAPGTTRRTAGRIVPRSTPQPIAEISAEDARSTPSGVGELDRVLGGGLVAGAVVLLAGEPGVGKSTLLLEVAARFARTGAKVLYVTGEESAAQVRLRAGRVNALEQTLYLAAETDLGAVAEHVAEVDPALLIVDSVQTIATADAEGSAGGVTQVREVAAGLTRLAKDRGMTTVLVGHVTKDGSIAGPRVLEHLVDVVLHFEGERTGRLRMVRGVKNRYGPSDEVGCFGLRDDGIEELPDPSGLFLSRTAAGIPGQCVTVTVEGRRPLVAEIQALVGPAIGNHPRRTSSGLDSSRVALALAVLERRGGVRLSQSDVFTATVGGVRITDPTADLAVCLAVASGATDEALPGDLVALGEVGLTGEIRPVTGVARRLAEAQRLGFKRAIVPPGNSDAAPKGMAVIECSTLALAWAAAVAPEPPVPLRTLHRA